MTGDWPTGWNWKAGKRNEGSEGWERRLVRRNSGNFVLLESFGGHVVGHVAISIYHLPPPHQSPLTSHHLQFPALLSVLDSARAHANGLADAHSPHSLLSYFGRYSDSQRS